MNMEPNKQIEARELTEKELEGIVGGKENAADPVPEVTGRFESELACPK